MLRVTASRRQLRRRLWRTFARFGAVALGSRSVRRLTIRFVSGNRSSAVSYIGGSGASFLLQRRNAASG
ncbi:MAG: hypothetical protein IJY93_05860 [Clostridia bacterium]|nr:hypothetical protein [Clostridia bacterium]